MQKNKENDVKPALCSIWQLTRRQRQIVHNSNRAACAMAATTPTMHLPLSGFLVLLLLVSGCRKSGPELAPVGGRVTLDGKPLRYANVTFQPDGKSPGMGKTDQDGHYELMYKRGKVGGPVGQNKVNIILDTELAHRPQNVPARYNIQSELQREIKPGQNEFDFDLTTDKKK